MPRFASITSLDEWEDYLDELDEVTYSRSRPHRAGSTHGGASTEPEMLSYSSDDGFNPSFTGTRHERQWVRDYLGPFYLDQLITDVLRVVKGGKEATVYCCQAHPSTELELIAAKVYRPRMFRTFKNDADYKWGRTMLDGEGKAMRDRRMLKAVQHGSKAGEAASHASWLSHEFTTMRLLHDHGADVPKPIAQDDNAILMSYLGDEFTAAPTLSEVRVNRGEAGALFERLLHNIEIMLQHDRIHGDLSAYNVLYWEGRVTIIDFPQVIDAYTNPNAFTFFQRDVERICGYFARAGIASDARKIAADMWRRVMPDETYQVRGSRW